MSERWAYDVALELVKCFDTKYKLMVEPAAVDVLSMLRPAHGQTELTKSTWRENG